MPTRARGATHSRSSTKGDNVETNNFIMVMFLAIQKLPLDSKRRAKLTAARDDLTVALRALEDHPSYAHMMDLNAAWARAHHTYAECQPTPPTPPRAGAGEKEVERKVA